MASDIEGEGVCAFSGQEISKLIDTRNDLDINVEFVALVITLNYLGIVV